MDKQQADAIAQAILQPGLDEREKMRQKREARQRSLADRRLVAWVTMPGFAIGALVAYWTGHRFAEGVVWGGFAGSLVGWMLVWWRRRRSAS
ncbi:hypothetical protein [Rubrivivax gelatinosus]|uniref:Uncharacterized protein n=1 Tax=Rubrivivax gelatinosus TaxID=28068 RepID=A0A4R2MG09_RUBGE|nr:hypothetical protein [Rubrivivax gelatinosus]MBK1690204.1 hypothetical protein [Rubrivivax gelatinosus]TCP03474.1 hypothetical protein EV684_104195 [Rubrivivax gelatinosus]